MGFSWPVAVSGYEWRPTIPQPILRPVKPYPSRFYRPLEEFTGLFRTFAETEPTPEGTRDFADRFGQLGIVVEGLKESGPWATLPLNVFETLPEWQEQIGLMRRAVAAWDRLRRGEGAGEDEPELKEIVNGQLGAKVALRLVTDTDRGGLALPILPISLAGALWLQLAQAVAGDKEFRACRTCGEWFELSPEVARTNRLFCSQGCRTRAYRERKEKAQQWAAEGRTPKEIAEELGSAVKIIKGWIKQRKGE